MSDTFTAPEILAGPEFFAVLEAFAARTGADFFAGCREASLREAAARVDDLRTAVLRLALAGRFFFTERLFMEPTISSKPTNEQKI
jgi:hypothetical protein